MSQTKKYVVTIRTDGGLVDRVLVAGSLELAREIAERLYGEAVVGVYPQ